jgi:uncharacterized membrane protein
MRKLAALTLPEEYRIEDPEGMTFAGGTYYFHHIINRLLPFALFIAGLILFVILIVGGFSMLTSAGSPEKMKAAQGKITSAIIGFIIIFISYWLMRILEIIFGISILS